MLILQVENGDSTRLSKLPKVTELNDGRESGFQLLCMQTLPLAFINCVTLASDLI